MDVQRRAGLSYQSVKNRPTLCFRGPNRTYLRQMIPMAAQQHAAPNPMGLCRQVGELIGSPTTRPRDRLDHSPRSWHMARRETRQEIAAPGLSTGSRPWQPPFEIWLQLRYILKESKSHAYLGPRGKDFFVVSLRATTFSH